MIEVFYHLDHANDSFIEVKDRISCTSGYIAWGTGVTIAGLLMADFLIKVVVDVRKE